MTMTKKQVLARIEAEITTAGSARALAALWKVSPSYLSDVRRGNRQPGLAILERLGLAADTRYLSSGTSA
jgi:hypothetical protein